MNSDSLIKNSARDSRLSSMLLDCFFPIWKTINGLKPAADTQSKAMSMPWNHKQEQEIPFLVQPR